MSSTIWGIVGSIYTAGGLVGALLAGPLSSKFGRLRSMQINTVFFAVGPAFEALAPKIGVLALGRFVSGLGAGSAMVIAPIYIAEIAPPAERGLFGSFTQVMVNVGIFVTQLLGLFLSKGQLWRVILAAGGVFGILQFVGLLFSVETPKYTAIQGHSTRAKRDLRRIRGDKFDLQEEIDSWGAVGDDADGKALESMIPTGAN
jgi:MFS family permease